VPKPKQPARSLAPTRPVETLIRLIRGQKVLLDADLAGLYGVATKVFNQAVQRNLDRFPEDFMFQLSKAELKNWRSQFVTTNPSAKMGLRRQPYAFTEHGVVMLCSVLRSSRAVQMNILIVRAFVRLREIIAANKDLATRIEKLERGHHRTASVIEVLVEDIDRLAREVKQMKALPPTPKRRIGFRIGT
jgi:hypothetical protein